ncbi:Eco57I restriction-modification methylase domain-containing protein [Methylomonas sp. MK1]|uniref:Eco57I restriction-modification methylase domain-containing protein n=1 Tax=Methylomonas sp. MK1 TaxID=1131552 RepID=UPI001360B567|nr:DNA methyltransferase [Methylomonas sp. MK1]
MQSKTMGYTLEQQFPINKAGQNGGQGKADLALGWFGNSELPNTPQVLCEFKDVRSGLDKPQNRKGNDRSPVKQCADYLKYASEQFTPYGNEKIQPTWGIVTDMKEFRLYWKSRMPQQCERFDIAEMIGQTESARQQRFLFSRVFHHDGLMNQGGESPLQSLLAAQRVRESKLEKGFYFEYRDFRTTLFKTLLAHNPNYQTNQRQLVRLSQKLLDRFLFILFCEDMGQRLDFPVNLLRDILSKESQDQHFDPEDVELWDGKIKRIFRVMREGGLFKPHTINRFNGGLFAEDDALEKLTVPNKVFCAVNQGSDAAALQSRYNNLLYFSANYNFGIEDSGERAVGLYALGRIFEQSITDLEIMEAEAAGTASLMKLSKRKTDGVYYTPEWVTAYIVEETLGLRLREIRAELGQANFSQLDAAQIDADHGITTGKLKPNTQSMRYFAWLGSYEQSLSKIKVLDPACGSGAFLIQALKRLLQEYEWIASERRRISYAHRQTQLFDLAKAYSNILTHNLFGVDINPESVEITKLALWLHTALPGEPLSSLDNNILCGNSLVDWDIETVIGPLTDEQRQRINPFTYSKAFESVFAAGGFDVIIGNPPYIKLQNMRQLQSETTDYWVKARQAPPGVEKIDQPPKFLSTQTGNYDIYLPFIEYSIGLLNPQGRMGFIAPNVWTVNEYGEGLRKKLHDTQQLERWVDFKSYQIFEEAITYTALQFFTGQAVDGIKLHFAPHGNSDLSALEWANIEAQPYAELSTTGAWQFMPIVERKLIEKLGNNCKRLDDESLTTAIFQGLITSADNIYHLTKLSAGRYISHADKPNPVEVAIEDNLMRPLVSGQEAKRYQTPNTETYLLFPYKLDETKPRLYTQAEMAALFPKGWSYLKQHEYALRKREGGKFDTDTWYQFGRNQNIDKQNTKKLLIPRLVIKLFCAVDFNGEYWMDNVDVGGVLVSQPAELFYIAGILNAPVANYVWRRISKPFQHDYYSANKQFIAPLPIPNATLEQKKQVAELAEKLQTAHSQYRDSLQKLDKRLGHNQMLDDRTKQSPRWLWPDLPEVTQLKSSSEAQDAGLKSAALTAWAKQTAQAALERKLQKLALRLSPNVRLNVYVDDGEVILQADGINVFSVFADEQDAVWIAAQWRQVIRKNRITPSVTATDVLKWLLNLKQTENASLRQQILDLDKQLEKLQSDIEGLEHTINALIYKLYDLNNNEIALIENQ